AMAEDMLIFGSDIPTHSFGTRQTPQSFDKTMMPDRVTAYILLQYIFIQFNMFLFIRSLVSGSNGPINPNAAIAILAIPSFFNCTWIVNRIIRREITVGYLVGLNVVISIISLIAGLLIGLTQVVGQGYQINFGVLLELVGVYFVGSIIGYF